jgi:hypothetical protein
MPEQPKLKRGFVVTAAMLVTAALLGYCHVTTTQLDAVFNKVKVGDTERDVIAKMGRPHQVLDGCGYYGRPVVGCAREYAYFPPWTLVDEAWTISLNADGVVINTAHFVSP